MFGDGDEELQAWNERLSAGRARDAGSGQRRPTGRLRVLTVADAMQMPARSFLLHGLIAEKEFSVWWGPPKCGKSFLMLRLAYGLSLGLGMWGRAARKVRVLYVAAEGQLGFGQRIRAIAAELGHSDCFFWLGQSVDLFDRAAHLDEMIALAMELGVELIVLDTMARVIPGANENDQRDMGVFVQHCDRIREEVGAHVAVVHHGKQDGEWGRGSTVIPGAVDLSVKITGGPGLEVPRKAEITHAKDDASGAEMPFRLRCVDLPPVDGEPRSTCLAEELDCSSLPDDAPKRVTLNPTQELWLRDIRNLFAAPDLAEDRVPVPKMGITRTITRDQLREGLRVKGRFVLDHTGSLTAADRGKMRDVLNSLESKGKIGMTDRFIWLLDEGRV
ncbi:AAA family ATPase [Roseomonas chloroacetimidivorans]|uniref:AAA family ATPase n=1 Tax=Roseomonas chloroacetimidivorans TaxID=1766656 RepID=UPI003C7097E9